MGAGQTLWRIAAVYRVEVEELVRVNGLDDAARIAEGQVIFVPGALFVLDVPPYPAPLPLTQAPGPRAQPDEVQRTGSPWVWPVEGGVVLSAFGAPRRSHRHAGVDIRGDEGQSVVAARGGRVSYSGAGMRGYGKTVVIDHGDGLSTLYAHNSELLVSKGQIVEPAQPIALLGRSGNATTGHCHFEIRRGGDPIDPLPVLGSLTAESVR